MQIKARAWVKPTIKNTSFQAHLGCACGCAGGAGAGAGSGKVN